MHRKRAKFTAEKNGKNSTEVNGFTITDPSNGASGICVEKMSAIFILETYLHSIAQRYKVYDSMVLSQPKAILHLTEDRLNGFAKEESKVSKTKFITFNKHRAFM